MTSPENPVFADAPEGTPKPSAHRHQPNIALATFKFGHIVALFVIGILLAQLGPLAAQQSALLQEGVNTDGKYITFVVLLALFLPFAVFATNYLRRGSSLDRILSTVLLLVTAVVSIVAAVYVVPAFYSVAAIYLFVVLALEWVGPLSAFWRGEEIDLSEVKNAFENIKQKRNPYGAPYGQPGPYGAPYGQPGPGAPYGQPGQPGPGAPFGAPYGQPGPHGAPYGQPGPYGAPYGQPGPGVPYGRPSGAQAASPQGPESQFGQGRPAPAPHETAPFAQPAGVNPADGEGEAENKLK